MHTKIQRWGNSLGLRIPKSFAEEAGVGAGSEVDLSVEEGELIVRPARLRRYDLKELLRSAASERRQGARRHPFRSIEKPRLAGPEGCSI